MPLVHFEHARACALTAALCSLSLLYVNPRCTPYIRAAADVWATARSLLIDTR